MAKPAYSTQATIVNQISTKRLTIYTKNDGSTIDAATVQIGIDYAGAYIYGRLVPVFGETIVDAWLLPDDVPPMVQTLSNDLAIYRFSVVRPDLAPKAPPNFQAMVDATLDRIVAGTMTIPGVNAPVTDQFLTEPTTSDFDVDADPADASVRPTWILPDPRDAN